jgi:hypothetical protein
MKSSTWSLAVVSLFFVAFALPPATEKTRDTDDSLLTFVATQSSKQKRMNICRARYRDCISLKQIPPYECQYVYEDCARNII